MVPWHRQELYFAKWLIELRFISCREVNSGNLKQQNSFTSLMVNQPAGIEIRLILQNAGYTLTYVVSPARSLK